jgi:hypothetical protein
MKMAVLLRKPERIATANIHSTELQQETTAWK